MYKACDIYPKYSFAYGDPLYFTESVKARLSELTDNERGREMRLAKYLMYARLKGWDISRDVNYAYAEILYEPEEILRRLLRLFPEAKSLWGAACFLSQEVRRHPVNICSAFRYYKGRSLKCYAESMLCISRLEHERGYSDALDFEP